MSFMSESKFHNTDQSFLDKSEARISGLQHFLWHLNAACLLVSCFVKAKLCKHIFTQVFRLYLQIISLPVSTSWPLQHVHLGTITPYLQIHRI